MSLDTPTIAVRPQICGDIDCWQLFSSRRTALSHAIGNRALDRYIALPEAKVPIALDAIRLMDGTRSFDEVAAALCDRYGARVEVRELYERLSAAGLVEGAQAQTVGELDRLSLKVFDLPVARVFGALEPVVRHGFGVMAAVAVAVIAIGLVIAAEFPQRVFDFSGLLRHRESWSRGFALFGLLMMVAYALHELAHGVAAVRYGLVPPTFRGRLYLAFIPVLLLRVPGLYTVPVPARLVIYAAGITSNLFLAGCALVLWTVTSPGPSGAHLMLKFALCNFIFVAQNLVPFLPTDGYLIFSTMLGKANVRSIVLREFQKWRSGEQHTLRGWRAAYFVASVLTLLFLLSFAVYRRSVMRLVVLTLSLVLFGTQLLRKRFER